MLVAAVGRPREGASRERHVRRVQPEGAVRGPGGAARHAGLDRRGRARAGATSTTRSGGSTTSTRRSTAPSALERVARGTPGAPGPRARSSRADDDGLHADRAAPTSTCSTRSSTSVTRIPAYAWMRRHEPIYRDRNGIWCVTRMEHLRDVERRAADFVSSRGYRSVWFPDETSMISPGRPGPPRTAQADLRPVHPAGGRRPEDDDPRAWSTDCAGPERGLHAHRGGRHHRRRGFPRSHLPAARLARRRTGATCKLVVGAADAGRHPAPRPDPDVRRHAGRASRWRRCTAPAVERAARLPAPATSSAGGPTPRSTGCPMSPEQINSELGPRDPRRRGDDAHDAGPVADPVQRAQRPVGVDGGRSGDDPHRGRGAAAVGHAAQQHVPHRRPATSRSTGCAWPRATGSRSCTRRPTVTRPGSPIPTRSTSPATPTRTSRSGSAPTSASARTSRGSSCGSRSRR